MPEIPIQIGTKSWVSLIASGVRLPRELCGRSVLYSMRHASEHYYNYNRPHGALNGQTPYERLLAKTAASVSAAS